MTLEIMAGVRVPGRVAMQTTTDTCQTNLATVAALAKATGWPQIPPCTARSATTFIRRMVINSHMTRWHRRLRTAAARRTLGATIRQIQAVRIAPLTAYSHLQNRTLESNMVSVALGELRSTRDRSWRSTAQALLPMDSPAMDNPT